MTVGVRSFLSDHQKFRDFVTNASAGAASGTIAATFVCPLDVIKTRFQIYGVPEMPRSGNRGAIVTSLQNIIRIEGLRGLYRGLSPTIVALLPNWAVYFPVYEQLKYRLHSHADSNKPLSIGANMIAAAGAGAVTAITTNPLWVVKQDYKALLEHSIVFLSTSAEFRCRTTQGMRSGVEPYTGVISALGIITRKEGMRGLYSGILPSLVGVSHVAIQFPAYEKIKCYLAKNNNTTVDKLSHWDFAIASSMAKVLASIITYPHEVVRSQLQEQGNHYTGVIDCIKKLYLKERLPGFYRGCATNLLRTIPSAVITFTSFEMTKRFLNSIVLPDGKRPLAHLNSDDCGKLVKGKTPPK